MDISLLFEGIREFGLAVVLVLAGGAGSFLLIKCFRADIKELQKDNKELQQSLLEISKSSLVTVTDLSRIANELSPSITALGSVQKEHLEAAIGNLKSHLDHKLEMLQRIVQEEK
jgi:hypothetical protein